MKAFQKKYIITLLFIIPIVVMNKVEAHPGHTSTSDNCHHCWSNCSYWGYTYGTRHTHYGGNTCNCYNPDPLYCYKPSCPSNSVFDSTTNTCMCNNGYCVNVTRTGCVYLPANAHCVDSTTDAWLCDYGYKEVGNSCIKKEVPKKIKDTINDSTSIYNKSSLNTSEDFTLDLNNVLWVIIAVCLGFIYKNIEK